jgi:hypothetical protein
MTAAACEGTEAEAGHAGGCGGQGGKPEEAAPQVGLQILVHGFPFVDSRNRRQCAE